MDGASVLLRIKDVLGFDREIVNFKGKTSNSGFNSGIFQVGNEALAWDPTSASTDVRWFRRKLF
jgi:hypothetical protein